MSHYCERINCNCKYCDKEDGCIFYSQGSGYIIDMPCYEEVEFEPEIDIREWLNSFNTNSATECFTAVQELKKRLEGDNDKN